MIVKTIANDGTYYLCGNILLINTDAYLNHMLDVKKFSMNAALSICKEVTNSEFAELYLKRASIIDEKVYYDLTGRYPSLFSKVKSWFKRKRT